jgi:hypothetical protein
VVLSKTVTLVYLIGYNQQLAFIILPERMKNCRKKEPVSARNCSCGVFVDTTI